MTRDRHFKYTLIAPSIFVLLLIGVFPLVYLLVVSFQGITMTNNDASILPVGNHIENGLRACEHRFVIGTEEK